jgi:uncharacterized membrane protein
MTPLAMRCGLALLALFGLLSFSTPATAQLELCNRTSYILYTAAATQSKDGVVTQGWTRIVPGDCKTAINGELGDDSYYVYARTSTAHGGPSREWAGPVRLCAMQSNFRVKTPLGTVSCAAEASALPFAPVQTKGAAVWTTTFTESKELGTVDAARTAGLKRLLRDNGAKLPNVDGKPDKPTGAALAAFRTRLKLAANAGTRGMFDALETEALKTAAPAGYAVCNDTEGDIWVATAMKEHDWVTRGWWKIAAGSCAKTITVPLKADKIFLHVEKHQNANLVSGPDKFCVTNVQFERQGRGPCGKGLSEVGFAATITKGLAGYSAHVGNQGLIAPLKPTPPAKPK